MKNRRVNSVPVDNGSGSPAHFLKIDARRDKITELLERDGQVRVAQLAELLNTSTVTIRSDLDSMERDGLVERVPGGAIPTTMSMYNREFLRRKRLNTEEKRAIAAAVAEEIEDGDTLFINGGSTTYFAALSIKKLRKQLVVVTNSLSVAIELGTSPTFTVILVGGQVNSYYSFTFGTEAMNQLQRYQVNKAILSIDGVSVEQITTIHPEESAVAEKMIERARKKIIIADGSKIGKEGFCTICKTSQVDLLITDQTADAEVLTAIRETGIGVQVV